MRTAYVFSGLPAISLILSLSGTPSYGAVTIDTLEFCASQGNAFISSANQMHLGEVSPQSGACAAHIRMTHSASDVLSSDAWYSVIVFPAGDITGIEVVRRRSVGAHDRGEKVLELDTRKTDLQTNHPWSRFGLPYSYSSCFGTLGLHRILFIIHDGDTAYEVQYYASVVDCTAPIVIDKPGKALIARDNHNVTLSAADLAGIAVDDCTGSDDLLYSFSPNGFVPTKTFFEEETPDEANRGATTQVWIADAGRDQNCDGQISWNERNVSVTPVSVRIVKQNGSSRADQISPIKYAGEVEDSLRVEVKD